MHESAGSVAGARGGAHTRRLLLVRHLTYLIVRSLRPPASQHFATGGCLLTLCLSGGTQICTAGYPLPCVPTKPSSLHATLWQTHAAREALGAGQHSHPTYHDAARRKRTKQAGSRGKVCPYRTHRPTTYIQGGRFIFCAALEQRFPTLPPQAADKYTLIKMRWMSI